MILDKLFDVISEIIKYNESIDEIVNNEKLIYYDLSELIQITDQEIKEFIKCKEIDDRQQKRLFDIFQKLKIEQSIKSINEDVSNDVKERKENLIIELFNKIAEPNDIKFTSTEVIIKYKLENNHQLKNKIAEIEAWDKDNVVETLSKKLHVPVDNIAFIDSVSGYVEFISSFDENNYVSRGQKDCKYKLEPSIHRIYSDSFTFHSSQYESAFKQRILYYDNTTERKNAEEIRAYGQHYGLPTNYLDFTEAHLISLLFAVEEYEYTDSHSIVYFVDSLSYNHDIVKAERKLIDFSDKEIRSSFEKEYADKSYFIKVGNCNERIHFQKGCFLKVEPKDSLSKMLEKYTKIAIIDKDNKENVLKDLFKLGITFENIYPDKDNMVRTIKFIKEHM